MRLKSNLAWAHERHKRRGVVHALADQLFQNQREARVLVYEDDTSIEQVLHGDVPAHTPFVQVWRIGSIFYRFEGPCVLTLALDGRPTFLRLEADIILTWMDDFTKRDYWKVMPGEDSHPGWANRVFREQNIRGMRRRIARKRITKRTAAQIVHYIDLLYEADPTN